MDSFPSTIASTQVGIYSACYKISIFMTLFIQALWYCSVSIYHKLLYIKDKCGAKYDNHWHRINGEVTFEENSRLGDVFNPATGEVERQVALASISQVDKAVAAAKNALESWSTTPPIQRARVMFKYKQLIEENIDELADMVGREHGKVLRMLKVL